MVYHQSGCGYCPRLPSTVHQIPIWKQAGLLTFWSKNVDKKCFAQLWRLTLVNFQSHLSPSHVLVKLGKRSRFLRLKEALKERRFPAVFAAEILRESWSKHSLSISKIAKSPPSKWNRNVQTVFESFFNSRVSIGYPQNRKERNLHYPVHKPKWNRERGMAVWAW